MTDVDQDFNALSATVESFRLAKLEDERRLRALRAENERLRSDLDLTQQGRDQCAKDAAALRAENERLREALRDARTVLAAIPAHRLTVAGIDAALQPDQGERCPTCGAKDPAKPRHRSDDFGGMFTKFGTRPCDDPFHHPDQGEPCHICSSLPEHQRPAHRHRPSPDQGETP